MTPQARAQAAIEILDAVIAAARSRGAPADRLFTDWFRTRRFAGSSDRRAVRELVYAAIRTCGEVPATGRAALLALAGEDPALAALFDGSRHAPAAIAPGEPVAVRAVAPAWLVEALTASGLGAAEQLALLGRAPLDIRLNPLKAALADLPEPGAPTVAPLGRRFPPGTPVEQWEAYRAGAIEVQDAGSQLVCTAVAAQPGERVVDLCAGAGGKTLALAAAMDNRGSLLACDADRARLSRLPPRAERAGVTIAETRLLDGGREAAALTDWQDRADAVLVDAPCSGTGTWRRNPEARWRLDPRELERLTALQARLLDVAAALVRPGGRLVHVVCSLLDAEGADQAERFLARHPDWRAVPLTLGAGRARGAGVRLTPGHDGTDGFFVARLERLC
ncbi:RsmB/NOP family class I SAM-dependent RNA methyltransferase [Novosphingobium piscinae]|uniref:RsmB/NOP family class I SAM-dependent RNA methyltransferase n=1 Tax=Novosphingobium piscinae TaxID=1507448 RepID=A0A7X1FW41_9SPHN|nr:RsmB/NOP family class I SAM-dependent RNA methyltransferase [Novosphingobium piscinae]MBC2668063.1 RsmB/NOP family class I SAM-dependent RNA methyltransferase [Novosphingobium piscinae]